MLESKHLKFGYQKSLYTKGLSAQFKPGQLIALLGRNGCGKSTFLRTLGQFLPPLEGELLLEGKNMQTLNSKALAAQVSIVTTAKIETPYLQVYDLVAMGRHPYLGFWGQLSTADKRLVTEILEELGIQHLAQKYLKDCSDGEQQLVVLARALAQQTSIILLDEATAHLDFINRVRIFKTLQDLAVQHQKIIFLATHEIEIALHYAHQVLLFGQDHLQFNSPKVLLETGQIQQVFETEGLDYHLQIHPSYRTK